jgi:alanine racemase
MNRLGFEPGDIATLCDMIVQSNSVEVKSIFSHLAASDDAGEQAFTLGQIARFEEMAQQISTAIGFKPIWHIANSNAIVEYPEAQFDMVRIGIGMYGIGMPAQMQLEPVHSLKTFVSQIKNLNKGATVGYGRKEKVEKTLKTATIAIGYADGLIRKAGNRR